MPRLVSEPRRIEVEQLVARGWEPERIARELHITLADVDRVVDWMDRVNEQPDYELPRRNPGVDAIIREEIAAVYSARVPEANSTAVPLPACTTGWERHRLAQATRRLRSVPHSDERDTA